MKLNLASIQVADMGSFWKMLLSSFGLSSSNLLYYRSKDLPNYFPRPYNGILSVKVAEEYGLKIPPTTNGIQEMLKEL